MLIVRDEEIAALKAEVEKDTPEDTSRIFIKRDFATFIDWEEWCKRCDEEKGRTAEGR